MRGISFLVALLLVGVWGQNVDYSFPMLGANLQRNGRVPSPSLKSPNLTWAFFDPNSVEFINSPIYDYINDIVWTESEDGFVYMINATTGNMTQEICVGKPPTFTGDPCGDVTFDRHIYGQLSLLSNRDVVMIYQQDREAPDVMVRISHVDGSVVWKYTLYNSSIDPTYNWQFLSFPTVVPGILPNNQSDAIIIWVNQKPLNSSDDSIWATYTIIDSETGEPVVQRPWLLPQVAVFPPLTVDPIDGNVIGQFTNDVQPQCGGNYEQFFLCTGIGKFHTLTGEVIWNNTMGEAFADGLIALADGNLYAATTQLYAYSYVSKTGQGRWKVMETTTTYDMYDPAVCMDDTVIFPDFGQFVQGWNKVGRPMKPSFWEATNGVPSRSAAVTNDGYFYLQEENTVNARSCKDGSVFWTRDFGDADIGNINSIAVGYQAVYANVMKPGTGGALIKLQDLGDDYKTNAYAW